MKKTFELGENATIFWDPSQSEPDNQKLLSGQKKQLDETEEVKKALRFGYIRIVSKGELEIEAEEDLAKKETDKKEVKK